MKEVVELVGVEHFEMFHFLLDLDHLGSEPVLSAFGLAVHCLLSYLGQGVLRMVWVAHSSVSFNFNYWEYQTFIIL